MAAGRPARRPPLGSQLIGERPRDGPRLVPRREGDRFRARDEALVDAPPPATTDHLGGSVARVDEEHRPAARRARRDRHDALAGACERDEHGGVDRQLRPRAVVESREPVDAVAREERDETPPGQERVVGRPNTHIGFANSPSSRASGCAGPPSGRRYRLHQPSRSLTKRRSPSGVHDGWTTDSSIPAGDELGRVCGSARGELGDVQFRAVPGHPRVVPAHVGDASPGGVEARGGVEVVAGGHDRRRPAPVGRQGDEVVDDAVFAVALAHADEGAPVRRHVGVRVSPGARRRRVGRDRARCAPARRAGIPGARAVTGRIEVLAVQPLVGEVAVDDALAAGLVAEGAVHAAAVFVYEGAGVHAGRRHVGDRRRRGRAARRRSAPLRWAASRPSRRPRPPPAARRGRCRPRRSVWRRSATSTIRTVLPCPLLRLRPGGDYPGRWAANRLRAALWWYHARERARSPWRSP